MMVLPLKLLFVWQCFFSLHEIYGSASVFLKCGLQTQRVLETFQEDVKVKTIFVKILRCYIPF